MQSYVRGFVDRKAQALSIIIYLECTIIQYRGEAG